MRELTSNSKIVLFNALSSVLQVAIVSISYFIIYRLIITTLGVDFLGIWALILATTSFANISNLGFSASLIKIVANLSAINRKDKIELSIQTAYISVAILIATLSFILYTISPWLLSIIIPQKYLKEALLLFPWSLTCLWINGVGGIFMSVLDGYQLIYQRNLISILSFLLLIIFSFLLIDFGLLGIAYSQAIQSFFMLICSIILVYKRLFSLNFLKPFWNNSIFKEIFTYGGKIQLMSILNLFWEPTTKYFFSFIGDLSALGIYEMASRLVTQIRSVIVISNQSIVPYVANKENLSNDELIEIYSKNLKIISLISIPLMIGIIVFSPFISTLWVGDTNYYFIYCLTLLSLSWVINIFSAPAYLINMATGDLKWNLITHCIYSFLNPLLCLILGYFFKSYGLVVAISCSLIIGSIYSIMTFHSYYKLKMTQKIVREGLKLIITIITQTLTIWWCFSLNINIYYSLTSSMFLFVIIYIVYLKFSSFNKETISWLTNKFGQLYNL